MRVDSNRSPVGTREGAVSVDDQDSRRQQSELEELEI